jgi:hypothetical protein
MEAPSTASPPAHSRAAFFSAQKHQLKSISSKASAQKHQLKSISSKASARKHQLESKRERSRTFLFPSSQSLSVSLVGRDAWSVEKTAENEW